MDCPSGNPQPPAQMNRGRGKVTGMCFSVHVLGNQNRTFVCSRIWTERLSGGGVCFSGPVWMVKHLHLHLLYLEHHTARSEKRNGTFSRIFFAKAILREELYTNPVDISRDLKFHAFDLEKLKTDRPCIGIDLPRVLTKSLSD